MGGRKTLEEDKKRHYDAVVNFIRSREGTLKDYCVKYGLSTAMIYKYAINNNLPAPTHAAFGGVATKKRSYDLAAIPTRKIVQFAPVNGTDSNGHSNPSIDLPMPEGKVTISSSSLGALASVIKALDKGFFTGDRL